MTSNPKHRLPGWAILLFVGVAFTGALLVMLLVNPPEKSLCEGPAPDFTVSIFEGYEGESGNSTINLSDLRGQGVVVNFWASWCKPCEEEAAELEAAWQRYGGKGIAFVGIDYLDQEPAARRYLEKFGVTYPNGPDLASRISKRYTIRGVPETFFVDPEGNLSGCRVVGSLTASDLESRIQAILPR